MWLNVNQSLATGFDPINTWQQRASLPFKPGVVERKIHVYNNDDKTFFSILTFAKPSCDNVLQPTLLRVSACNSLSHSGLATVNIRKRIFYPLNKACPMLLFSLFTDDGDLIGYYRFRNRPAPAQIK